MVLLHCLARSKQHCNPHDSACMLDVTYIACKFASYCLRQAADVSLGYEQVVTVYRLERLHAQDTYC